VYQGSVNCERFTEAGSETNTVLLVPVLLYRFVLSVLRVYNSITIQLIPGIFSYHKGFLYANSIKL